MSKSNANVLRLCRVAMLMALYFLLNLISIRAGNLRITFASLPVVVSALLFGPAEAVLVALGGEFLNQMLSYGFTATTVLWLIPPAVRGLVVGLAALRCRASSSPAEPDQPLESRPLVCYAVCVAAALCTTAVNTAVIALDAVLYGYYSQVYVFGELAWRLASGSIIAVIIATVAMPLTVLLRRRGLVRTRA